MSKIKVSELRSGDIVKINRKIYKVISIQELANYPKYFINVIDRFGSEDTIKKDANAEVEFLRRSTITDSLEFAENALGFSENYVTLYKENAGRKSLRNSDIVGILKNLGWKEISPQVKYPSMYDITLYQSKSGKIVGLGFVNDNPNLPSPSDKYEEVIIPNVKISGIAVTYPTIYNTENLSGIRASKSNLRCLHNSDMKGNKSNKKESDDQLLLPF